MLFAPTRPPNGWIRPASTISQEARHLSDKRHARTDLSGHEKSVRPELAGAIDRAWRGLGVSGTWWRGEQRIAIAAETRRAATCEICTERLRHLSPAAVTQRHEGDALLPAWAVEAAHCIASDPGRLHRGWYDSLKTSGLVEEQYVELVSIVAELWSKVGDGVDQEGGISWG